MPRHNRAAYDLAPLSDGSTAGEMIPEFARHCPEQSIELEVSSVLGADWVWRTEKHLRYQG